MITPEDIPVGLWRMFLKHLLSPKTFVSIFFQLSFNSVSSNSSGESLRLVGAQSKLHTSSLQRFSRQ